MYFEPIRENLERQREIINDFLHQCQIFRWALRFVALAQISMETIFPYDSYTRPFAYIIVTVWLIIEFVTFREIKNNRKKLSIIENDISAIKEITEFMESLKATD